MEDYKDKVEGGYIENNIVYIPYQTPTWPPLEQTAWVELPEKQKRFLTDVLF
jgi:hypothetical protein